MPRKDPSLVLLPEIPFVRETKGFTDPRVPGEEWEFTFEYQPGIPSTLYLTERKQKLIDDYIRGGAQVRSPGGGTIPISESLCGNIAFLQLVDRTTDEQGPPWSFSHWAIFAKQCPTAFYAVIDWACELQDKAFGKPAAEVADEGIDTKNDSPASVEPSSVPLSPETNSTPI